MKPPATEVPSDDCTVTVDGVVYRPHEGESVWLFTSRSIGELSARNRLLLLQAELMATTDDAERVRVSEALDDVFSEICALIAGRLVRWTWTDMAGRPLPQPDGTGKPLEGLQPSEVAWLMDAAPERSEPSAASETS